MYQARPCDEEGNFLPDGAPPPPLKDDAPDWWPYDNRPHFEFANWNYKLAATSGSNLDELLKILAAAKVHETGDPTAYAFFHDHKELLQSVDALPYGDLPWFTIKLKYTGPITPDTPEWKLKTYTIYTRNPLHVVEQIAGSTDFRHTWDYEPYEEYTEEDCRRFSNLMSGRWAFKKAVSDRISDPSRSSKSMSTLQPSTVFVLALCRLP